MYRITALFGIALVAGFVVFFPWKSSAKHHDIIEKLGIAENVENVYLAEEKEILRKLVHADLGAMENDGDLEKVKKILKHQATFAKFEFHQFDATKQKYRALAIYHDMRFGNIGYLCNGHADLFLGLLEIYGISGRRILGESINPSHPAYHQYLASEPYASHSTVEVQIDGRWIIADPTFFVLPKYQGDYVSLRRALEIVCADRHAHFDFETLADTYPIQTYYQEHVNGYFQDLMFARVIVYKPFHKYPYDDVCKCLVKTDHGIQQHYFTMKHDMVLETLTPAEVPFSALRRERKDEIAVTSSVNANGGGLKRAD